MGRPLGIFETAETMTNAHGPLNVVGVFGLETGISSRELRGALDRAQRRHPLLRARITEHEGRFHYAIDGVPPVPLEIVAREDDDHWQRVSETELNRAFDPATGPMMRCTLLAAAPGTVKTELVVSFLHTIIDGNSAINLMREVLEAWEAGASGRRLDEPEVLDLQPPVEAFFPPEYRGISGKIRVARFVARQLTDEIGYRWRARGTRRMPVHRESQCRTLFRDFGGDDLHCLIRAARRHRVTLNSILNAAALISVQQRLYGGAAVPLRSWNFGIVRPYLRPPVADHHLGSFHVMLRSTVNVERGQDIWRLAEQVNSQLAAMGRTGDRYLSLLTVKGGMQFLLRQRRIRMGASAVAYTGPLKLPEEIGAIRVRSVRAMVANLVIGPEFTAHARLFGDRLWWDHVYLDCDMDRETAAGITDEIFDRLKLAGKEAT